MWNTLLHCMRRSLSVQADEIYSPHRALGYSFHYRLQRCLFDILLLILLWTLLAGYELNPDLFNNKVSAYHVHVNYTVQTHRRCCSRVVVHFNRLINPLEYERNHWIRNRASSSHLPTPINLPEIYLTVVLPFSSLFPYRCPFENYLCLPHFSPPHFQPVRDSYIPYA